VLLVVSLHAYVLFHITDSSYSTELVLLGMTAKHIKIVSKPAMETLITTIVMEHNVYVM